MTDQELLSFATPAPSRRRRVCWWLVAALLAFVGWLTLGPAHSDLETFGWYLAAGLALACAMAFGCWLATTAVHARRDDFRPTRLLSLDAVVREGTLNHRRIRLTLYGVLLALGADFGLQTWHGHRTELDRQTESTAIELAAVQRMLSQQIARLALSFAQSGPSAPQSDLLAAMARSDETTRRLADTLRDQRFLHGPEPGELDLAWRAWLRQRAEMIGTARALIDRSHPGESAFTAALALQVQVQADKALRAVQALLDVLRTTADLRHAARAKQLRGWAMLNIVILAALAVLAIEPAVRSMRRQYRRLAQQAMDQQRLALVAERTTNAVAIVDGRRRLTWVNEAFCRITATHAVDIIGQDVLELFSVPGGGSEAVQSLRRSLGGVDGARHQIRHRSRDGNEHWLDVDVQALPNHAGLAHGHVIVSSDITQIRRAEADLRIAAIAFESLGGIVITDAQERILRVNAAFTMITGYPADEAMGRRPGELLRSGRHERAYYDAMRQALARDRHWQGEIWNRRKNGEVYPQWISISAVQDPRGAITNYVAVFTDITEKKKADETIHSLAFFDPLTKLPNRRLLRDRIVEAIGASSRSGRNAALLFIDLDNFKELNDSKGHDVGDQLLREVAGRLSAGLRADDTVARHGGDEFVVLLTNLSAEAAQASSQVERIAEAIRRELTRPYMLASYRHHTSPSIGINLFLGSEHNADELLKRADSAMYLAKRSGRNTYRFFDPMLHAALERRVEMEADLRRAFEAGELQLHFQPQVDERRAPKGAEVLLRWEHASRGRVPPGQFIPLAEESDLIVDIGNWVLEQAARQLVEWNRRAGWPRIELAVNVSAKQFRRTDFASTVRAIVERTGLRADLLKLELTESLILTDVDEVVATMHALRELGVKLSLDDFGTGQSSLSYLTRLPLDQLKIDQSFVRNLTQSRPDAVVVQTIIGLARSLGIDVIAEGVETDDERAILESMGCLEHQGYLCGHPMPLDEFESFVARTSTFASLGPAGG